MNIQSRPPTTPEEFLRWNEGREGKWDFVEGRVVDMMVRASRNHAVLCSRMIMILGRHLPIPPYTVSSADFGVRTANSVRYPDVMVDAAAGHGTDLAAEKPVLVAEVLSPSTMTVDFGPKAVEYQTIPTLGHYLVLAQDEPRVWLWSRGIEGNWLDATMIDGADSILDLPALSLSIAMTELYAGIDTRRT